MQVGRKLQDDGQKDEAMTEHGGAAIRVRPARLEDLAAAGEILVEGFRSKFQAAFAGHMERAARVVARTLALEVEQGRCGLFVAEIEGQIAGTISLRRHGDPESPGWPATRLLLEEVGLLRGLRAMLYMALLDQPFGPGEVYVSDVAVAAAFRRRGVGQALMRHAEQVARLWGMQALVLDVNIGNHPARRLYRRLGFGEERVRFSFLAGWLLGMGEWLRMRKALPPAGPA